MSLSAEEERAFARIVATLRTDPHFARVPPVDSTEFSGLDPRRWGRAEYVVVVLAVLAIASALLRGAHPAAVIAGAIAVAALVTVTVLATTRLIRCVKRWYVRLRYRYGWQRRVPPS